MIITISPKQVRHLSLNVSIYLLSMNKPSSPCCRGWSAIDRSRTRPIPRYLLTCHPQVINIACACIEKFGCLENAGDNPIPTAISIKPWSPKTLCYRDAAPQRGWFDPFYLQLQRQEYLRPPTVCNLVILNVREMDVRPLLVGHCHRNQHPNPRT